MKQRLRVGFYKLRSKTPGVRVSALWEKIAGLPNDGSRTVNLYGAHILTRTVRCDVEHVSGDFARIRPITSMLKADKQGGEHNEKYGEDDRKPAETTAFLYDSKSGVLHIQEVERGVSAYLCCRYLKGLLSVDLECVPVLRDEFMEIFQQQKIFTFMSLRLTGLDHASFLRDEGLSDEEVIKFAHKYRAPKLTVALSLDASDEGTLSRIQNTVTSLLMLPKSMLKRLRVKGKRDSASPEETIDFIRDRITFTHVVESETGREPTDEERYGAVREAWVEHRDALRIRFRET
jgi:hypothetical protein